MKGLVRYDSLRRRLWIRGQRCHHGAAGIVVAAIGFVGLISDPDAALRHHSRIALAAAGGALIIHDWKDRSIWFERGPGSQP